MRRAALLLTGVLLVAAVAPVTAMAAGTSAETVTLTVSVVNEKGDSVGGATIHASWDGGNATAKTASNGKAFVDVPKGEDVKLDVSSKEYTLNFPKLVEDASAREVTVEVAQKGRITVHARNESGPIPSVTVELSRAGKTVAKGPTTEKGAFTSGVIEQGSYSVSLFKSGYFRNRTVVSVGANSSLTFRMKQGTVNVQFRVVDDHFDEPRELRDAKVAIEGIGTQRTTQGTVTFTVPVNSRYHITATKEGYQTNETTTFIGTESVTKTFVINKKKRLTVEPSNERVVVGERVSVTVTNAYDDPVPNATVLLNGEAVGTTGANGQVRFAIPSEGPHTITAKHGGVTSAEVTVKGVAVATKTPEQTPSPTPEKTATPSPTPEIPLPGFGLSTAILALLGAALLSRLR